VLTPGRIRQRRAEDQRPTPATRAGRRLAFVPSVKRSGLAVVSHGEPDPHRGATLGAVVRGYDTRVRGDDPLDEGEADAHPTLTPGEEGLEQPGPILLGEAGASVQDDALDARTPVALGRRREDVDGAAFAGVKDRVVEEVVEYLGEMSPGAPPRANLLRSAKP